MAIYRTVSMSFWTDNKVTDDFTPEDRYFYLYLFTNPHTNLCGCYEVSIKQIANETGYSKDSVENLINRFENVHKVLRFSKETKEVLLLNWSKYNWTSSEKFRKPLYKEIQCIKCNSFKSYLQKAYDGENKYGIDTTCIDTSVTVTDTDTVTDTVKYRAEDLLDILLREHNMSQPLSQAVHDWLSYKKERRFTYKEQGLKTLIKTISDKSKKYGEDKVIDLIAESISSGYQGIVWDKLEKRNGSTKKNNQFNSFPQRDYGKEQSQSMEMMLLRSKRKE